MNAVRRGLAMLVTAAAGAACGGTDPGSAPSVVVIYQGSAVTALTFNSIGEIQVLSAYLVNSNGDSVGGGTPTFATGNASVVTVNAQGQATSVASGSTSITVSLGGSSAAVPVSVAQVLAVLNKVSGDNQTGTVGAALAQPLTVGARDANNTPIPGLSLAFAVTGGGQVSQPTATTDGSGNAAVNWTLGTSVTTTQNVTVTAPSKPGVTASFGAVPRAGAPAAVVVVGGNNQTATPSFPLTTPLDVRVDDQFGNPVAARGVNFAVTAGGGSVIPANPKTNAAGVARAYWTVGGAGANTATATTGTATTATFNATVSAPGAAATIALREGNTQTGLTGYPVNVDPAVLVTDAAGRPVAGHSVTFGVSGGGGSVGSTSVNTDASGVARTPWTVGSGTNSLAVTASGLTGSPVNFTATGGSADYSIVVNQIAGGSLQAYLDSAAQYWMKVINGDVPDINVPAGFVIGSFCIPSQPALSGNIDDVYIYVLRQTFPSGSASVLASAGPCYIRTVGILPVIGVLYINEAHVSSLISSGQMVPTLIHEMGHVLGFGSIWTDLALLAGENSADPSFAGAQALAAFDRMGGRGYTGGAIVPVENVGDTISSVGSHWRESVFANELMTSVAEASGPLPMSRLSIAAMADLGYRVNMAMADAYVRVFTLPPAPAPWAMRVDFTGDVRRGPIQRMDVRGRITGTIHRR